MLAAFLPRVQIVRRLPSRFGAAFLVRVFGTGCKRNGCPPKKTEPLLESISALAAS